MNPPEFQPGDDIAIDMINTALGHKERPMDDSISNKINYGNAEVVDQHGKGHGVPVKQSQQELISALQKMPYGARMAWARRHRPSLEKLALQPAGLSSAQQKALDKQARKRAARLARKAKGQ